MNNQYKHFFKEKYSIAARRLIFEVGPGPEASPPDSAEAKQQPSQPKEDDLLTRLGQKLKNAPANAPLPADIRDTINGVRAEIQQVQNEIVGKLENIQSGQVSAELRKQLGEVVRRELGQVIGDLSPLPGTSVSRVRQVVEQLKEIAKIAYRDGKIRVEEVRLKSPSAGRNGYELHYVREYGYGHARLGPLSVHGGASAEAGIGQLGISGPGGLLVEITAGEMSSGDRAHVRVSHKSRDVSVVAGTSTDRAGMVGSYANLNARPGGDSTLSAAVRHEQQDTDIVVSYQGNDLSLEVGRGAEGTTFQAQYSGKTGSVETGVTLPPGLRTFDRDSLADAGAAATAFARGEISLPGGGEVGTSVTSTGGNRPAAEFNASIPLLRASATETSATSGAPEGPTATLGIGVAPGQQYTVSLAGTF